MHNLLLVDDEPEIVEGLQDLLDRHFSFNISSTIRSAEAMDTLRAGQTDILVSDIKMPKYTGFDLAEEARRVNPDAKVIFLTGYAQFDYAYSAIKSGCDDYILKTNSDAEIVAAIQRLLDTMEINPGESLADSDVLAYVKQYILDHIGGDLSLQKLAKVTYYNSSYLSRIFKQNTGVTLSEFIMEARINKAKVLLQKSRLKVYEVSQQVGFDTPIYFNRVFKKMTGSTPKDFKKSLRYK